MVSNKNINELANKFESTFSDGNGVELGNRLRTEDESIAEELIGMALRNEKFPMDANMYNVKADIIIKPGMSNEEWANGYVDAQNIETQEEFQQALKDDLFYFISDNLNRTNISVKIYDSLKEWLEKHGTVEYLAQEMEKAYEPQEFEEVIKIEASTEVEEKVKHALSEEGFPPNTDVKNVDYLIANPKITATYEGLAERHIDDVESSGSVQGYINSRFYKDIIRDNAFSFDVEITTDPEDLY
ncbi:TPA: hypothetical protein PDU86_002357 [Staphylococcus aureus]|nr:hypothetical protein [Staphylococcus singaporensis]HDA4896568.1 hypothetical protein [Staphylococcus aureus]HDB3374733.1 hypothetical protein [Staphylococcus aureus]HDE6392847.1 hypothetical protein [Staphylococcus aureus]